MFVVAKECSSQFSRYHIEWGSQELNFFLVIYTRQCDIQRASSYRTGQNSRVLRRKKIYVLGISTGQKFTFEKLLLT